MLADLKLAMDALEAKAGAVTSANDTETGMWLRIRRAAETLGGTTGPALDNMLGNMLRTAVALEATAGTSGAEENVNYHGYLKRIVDALEVKAGAVGTSTLEERFKIAATNAVFVALPSFFSEARMWLDANDLSGADGSAVNSWSDKTANANNATKINTAPILQLAAVNGKKVVYADNSPPGNHSDMSFPNGMTTGVTEGTLLYVGKMLSLTGGEGGGALFGDFGSDAQSNHYPFSDGQVYEDFLTTARKTCGAFNPYLFDYHVGVMRSKASLWDLNLVDGVRFTTATNTVGVNSGTKYLFRSSGNWGDWALAWTMFIPRSLTDAERNEAIAWLKKRFDLPWGLYNAANAPLTLTDGGGHVHTITKSTGLDATYDASAPSIFAFPGDFLWRFRANQATKTAVFGATTAVGGTDNTSIQQGFFFVNDGGIGLQIDGVWGGLVSGGGYDANLRVWLKRVGTTLTLWTGTSDDFSTATLRHTYAAAVTGDVFQDNSIYHLGGAFQILLKAL